MSGTLVIAEHRRGVVADVTLELVAAGLELEQQGAGPVTVALIGAETQDLAAQCAVSGLAAILAIETGLAFEPHVTQAAVQQLVEELKPAVILAGHTVDGCGFAPALAAREKLGFASNVMAASWSGGELHARRGAYGDRLVTDLTFERPVTLLMIRPGAYPRAEVSPSASVPITTQELAPAPRCTHLGYREVSVDGVDITAGDFLLSIGRGIGEEENVDRFAELADKLGALLSASRPLVDAGWVPSARQVGQSGRTVKPKVYLALGISGAAQHLAGIRDAETIIAINTDAEAPIFNVARYGAAVDLFELADELESRL